MGVEYGDEDYGGSSYGAAYDRDDLILDDKQDDSIPEVVKTFVSYFYHHIREKNVFEILQMYEGSFNKLSERLYSQKPWPSVESVIEHAQNDHVFGILYQEMYFRHLYAHAIPTFEQRAASWNNYCDLFEIILDGKVNIQLPNQWLWDMIDEFIYQFQSFCQFRAKMKSRTEEELQLLAQNDTVWNVYGVFNFLQALIEKSRIIQILSDEAEGKGVFNATDGYDGKEESNVLKVLGYFSIVGLVRLHSLIGDYISALQRLAPIDISQPGVYQRVIGCHITTLYYFAFACLMQRRYVDSIKSLNTALLTISKAKQAHEESSQFEHVLKKNEQMYSLLAISLTLCPQGSLLDEAISSQLREKFSEKMLRMQRGDDVVFDELFSFACPKFITPSAPKFDDPLVNYNQDAYRLQLKLFLTEVKQQQQVFNLRSYLKLYTTISIPKLASLMDVDVSVVRNNLLTFKHKSKVIELNGSESSNSDIDFYMENDVVHVIDNKITRKFGDYFIRHIVKFDDLVNELDAIQIL